MVIPSRVGYCEATGCCSQVFMAHLHIVITTISKLSARLAFLASYLIIITGISFLNLMQSVSIVLQYFSSAVFFYSQSCSTLVSVCVRYSKSCAGLCIFSYCTVVVV